MKSFVLEYKYYLEGELNLSLKTVDSYISDVQLYIDFITNVRQKSDPEDIETEDVRRYFESIKRKYLKPTSQARKLTAIKSFHRFLLAEKYVTRNVVKQIDTPKQRHKLPNVLTIPEVNQLLSILNTNNILEIRNKAMIEIVYACGLRVSELVDLRLSDLHLSDGFISVKGKGSKERVIPINIAAINSLNFYLINARPHLANIKSKNYVFLNKNGSQTSRQNFFLILKEKAIQAGIKKPIGPHTLRHSLASHLLEKGLDLRLIQEILGHESISTTEIYTEINNPKLKKVYTDAHPRARKD